MAVGLRCLLFNLHDELDLVTDNANGMDFDIFTLGHEVQTNT